MGRKSGAARKAAARQRLEGKAKKEAAKSAKVEAKRRKDEAKREAEEAKRKKKDAEAEKMKAAAAEKRKEATTKEPDVLKTQRQLRKAEKKAKKAKRKAKARESKQAKAEDKGKAEDSTHVLLDKDAREHYSTDSHFGEQSSSASHTNRRLSTHNPEAHSSADLRSSHSRFTHSLLSNQHATKPHPVNPHSPDLRSTSLRSTLQHSPTPISSPHFSKGNSFPDPRPTAPYSQRHRPIDGHFTDAHFAEHHSKEEYPIDRDPTNRKNYVDQQPRGLQQSFEYTPPSFLPPAHHPVQGLSPYKYRAQAPPSYQIPPQRDPFHQSQYHYNDQGDHSDLSSHGDPIYDGRNQFPHHDQRDHVDIPASQGPIYDDQPQRFDEYDRDTFRPKRHSFCARRQPLGIFGCVKSTFQCLTSVCVWCCAGGNFDQCINCAGFCKDCSCNEFLNCDGGCVNFRLLCCSCRDCCQSCQCGCMDTDGCCDVCRQSGHEGGYRDEDYAGEDYAGEDYREEGYGME